MSESKELTVGDLSVPAFLELLAATTEKKRSEEPTMGDLTVKAFTEEMVRVVQGKAMQGAAQEQAIGQQVMQDWAGLRNVLATTQPFRIESREDYERFVKDLEGSVGGRAKVVVAVALLQPDGGYSAPR